MGEPHERDGIGGGDLGPVVIETGRGRALDQVLELHEEIPDPGSDRHPVILPEPVPSQAQIRRPGRMSDISRAIEGRRS